MLFTVIMKRIRIFLYGGLAFLAVLIWMFSDTDEDKEDFSEVVKIALRDVGHQVLLANQDSTSLVLPIYTIEKTKYRLSFQNQVTFEPGRLVSTVKESFKKASLPEYYRVEVVQCTDLEVAYSYEIKNDAEIDIIPCRGRILPKNCYTIEVRFTRRTTSLFNKQTLLYLLIIIALLSEFFFYKRKQARILREGDENFAAIGSFHFYPEQNKLVKAAIEINLSKKECELLAIFVANPNQIIKRDELTKRVWEDNGVIVGRSLDTYISKLRKKLKDDDTIKLINVHGVGYKLEIS